MKVYSLDKKNKFTTRNSTLEEYFRITPPEIFKKWQDLLFNPSVSSAERKVRYNLLKDDIAKLKYLFKKRVIELNELAREKGFSNYLDTTLSLDQISEKKYLSFLKNIDTFITLVLSDNVPMKILMKQEKDWNIFNTPYPLGNQLPDDRFEIPNQVFSLLAAYDQRALKYRDRLDIKYDRGEFYTSANFNKGKNLVEIRINDTGDDIYQVLGFVGALGHAFDMLQFIDSGKDPFKIPRYLSKYNAIKYRHDFLKHYVSLDHQKVIRYNLLSEIATTLFEISIFTNSNQDFDKIYAGTINRCYPMTKQTQNPFYVYFKRFLIRPMGGLLTTIIEMELYLKDAKFPPSVI